MSEIKNVRQTWMALNSSKRNHLMPMRFKGLKLVRNELITDKTKANNTYWLA